MKRPIATSRLGNCKVQRRQPPSAADGGPQLRRSIAILFGLATIALVGLLLTVVVVNVFQWFTALPAETMATVASIAGVISVPVITYFTTRSLEARRSRENALRERKTEFYEGIIKDILSMFNLGKSKQAADNEVMVELFARVPAPMISFASRSVIVAWNKFRRVAQADAENTKAIALAFEDLFKAMRKDLGHNTFMHQPGELLGTFVNGVDELMGRNKSARK